MLEIGKTTTKELLDKVNDIPNSFVDLGNEQTITGKKIFDTIPKSPKEPTEADDIMNYGTFSSAIGDLLPNTDWEEIHIQLYGAGGRYSGGQYSDIYLITEDMNNATFDYSKQYVALTGIQLPLNAQGGFRNATYGGVAILITWKELQEMYPSLAVDTNTWINKIYTAENTLGQAFRIQFNNKTTTEEEVKKWLDAQGLKNYILAIGSMNNCYDSGGYRFAYNLFYRYYNGAGAIGRGSPTTFDIYFIKVGRHTKPIYDISYTSGSWGNSLDYNTQSKLNKLDVIHKGGKTTQVIEAPVTLTSNRAYKHMALDNKAFIKPLIEEATIDYVTIKDINQSINGQKTFTGSLLYSKNKGDKSDIREVVSFGDKIEQEDYWNRNIEMLKEQIAPTLEMQGLHIVFNCTASSGEPYNTYCGLSNCQFLDTKGKVWYVVARKLVQYAGSSWNSIWISRTKPNEEGWNLGWSKVKAVTDETDPYLEQFGGDLIEVKARQNSTAGNYNTWGWGIKSFQVVCEYDTDQSKMGSLSAGSNAPVTIEFLIEKSQIDKPCFKEIATLRGVRGGFSNGASNPTQGVVPSAYYMCKTLTIKVGYLYGDKGTGLVYTYNITDNLVRDKNLMFRIPILLSEGASINDINNEGETLLDLASATGMTYKNTMFFTGFNISKEPINISMVNINNNNFGYTFTQAEYDQLPQDVKMNNKLFIITDTSGA